MVNSNLILWFPGNFMLRKICSNSTQIIFFASTKTRGTSFPEVKTNTNERKCAREVYSSIQVNVFIGILLMYCWQVGGKEDFQIFPRLLVNGLNTYLAVRFPHLEPLYKLY